MAKLTLKIWVLIIALLFSLLAISPSFQSGVLIKSVEKNSTAFDVGLRKGMVINSINGQPVSDISGYSNIINGLFLSDDSDVKVLISTDKGDFVAFSNRPLNITVGNTPHTKIKTGLDLQGGARALVKPEVEITSQQLDDLIAVTNNRLNVFGISDVNIRAVSDLSGNKFMLVEVAGATPSDIRELIAKQGKFEAKIGNDTVFVGGSRDITNVCRFDATCSGIRTCQQSSQDSYFCQFSFAVYLSQAAAEKHADITSKLGVNVTGTGRYLDKSLDLLVDDNLLDSLLISEGLKGQVTTQISVQGSGTGATQEEAFDSAMANMNKLQTVLITGSLPFKLEIVKLDTISPALGGKFTNYILLAGLLSVLGVSLIVLLRYRSIKYSLALILTSFSEVFIIIGVAAFINWSLDLASIAGILIVIGTGIDQQIIILDESRGSKGGSNFGFVERLKRAWFIIIGAYFTALASLIPLYWAGAGLLRGFAFTSILGVTIGFLITRPAFADIIKKISGNS
ncbi:hypothetical protein COU61_04920 [Candidatus Pacearchaeota archaeon CG10_big_fil_rev_8_21_14_0_10_35_13]|nr:MAG: hypothetical protein COU61_04920 [Candidatus Pacearchaeota archaeon CG10_big_fil_rev_8_21_14_0_10_35_13]